MLLFYLGNAVVVLGCMVCVCAQLREVFVLESCVSENKVSKAVIWFARLFIHWHFLDSKNGTIWVA